MRKGKIICVDIETTGLDMTNDEILQISIINGSGEKRFITHISDRNTKENGKRQRK